MPLDATGYVSPRVLTPDEARDLAVLKAARHSIRHRWSWWGGSPLWYFVPGLQRVCALTAVNASARARCVRAAWAQQRLADNLPPGWSCVAAFNDHSTTTHSDILALYDRAIAELE
jgi:hypothetical protein